MTTNERTKLAQAVRERYQASTKSDKSKLLNDFVAITGFHRKYATRILRDNEAAIVPRRPVTYKRIYDEAVKEALIVLWEAEDRICGKRLKAIIPVLLVSLESHKRLKLDVGVRERLLVVSAATIDRLFRPIRPHWQSAKGRRPAHKARAKVAINSLLDRLRNECSGSSQMVA
jgi:hypothetical protein